MKYPFLANEISRLKSASDAERVIKKFVCVIPRLSGSMIACCINILSKRSDIVSHDYLRKITNKLITYDKDDKRPFLLKCLDVRDVCTILNSFSNLNYNNESFLNAASDRLNSCLDSITARESSNAIFSLTKLNPSSKLFLNKPIKQFVNTRDLTEQDTSMLITALCNRKNNRKRDVNLLIKAADSQKDHFSDQSLSNIVNSISKLACNSSDRDKYITFLNRLIPIISARLDNGGITVQGISNIANGYGKLGIKNEGLYYRIGCNLVNRILEFTPRGIINVLNAYAKIDYPHKNSFVVSAKYLIDKLDDFTPQCYGNVLAAFAKFNHNFKDQNITKFYKACSVKLCYVNDFSNYIPQNYCNILNGLAKVGVVDDKLFTNFSIQLENCDCKFAATDVSVLIKAYSKSSVLRKGFLAKFCTLAQQMSKEMSPMELSSSINSLDKIYRVDLSSPNSNFSPCDIVEMKNNVKNTLKSLLMTVKNKADENVQFRALDIKLIRKCIERLKLGDNESNISQSQVD
ncbi:hypothetical protein BmR1_04g09545 [Babesia microti strain RI]|uniref:Uncharacterized protein n=1 Tax=Babesia microti (strain RI) TaxID=1133968 RepID=I7IA36_BABMR|nr:hypothetical protein BmR1_04g09545 [Babesia microti strain RI]CCF76079.1 hypothetical protein BmR1_04g09545 [Babesia microti strain RI]|eukprot:XP_012650487.1 hypothetical protein BmR1_04g09545 [Babesia microti strain RI]